MDMDNFSIGVHYPEDHEGNDSKQNIQLNSNQIYLYNTFNNGYCHEAVLE